MGILYIVKWILWGFAMPLGFMDLTLKNTEYWIKISLPIITQCFVIIVFIELCTSESVVTV